MSSLSTQDIEAGVDAYADGGLRLHSKVEQSNIAEEKSGIGSQDPVLTQIVLDDTSYLTPGKPFVLGFTDIPGSTGRKSK